MLSCNIILDTRACEVLSGAWTVLVTSEATGGATILNYELMMKYYNEHHQHARWPLLRVELAVLADLNCLNYVQPATTLEYVTSCCKMSRMIFSNT